MKKHLKVVSLAILSLALATVCLAQEKFILQSAAFEVGGTIPGQYTCDGRDISPPLTWAGLPEKAQSLALVCDDPDAPMGTWVHWVYYNISPDVTGLPQGVPTDAGPSTGGTQGITSFKRTGYGGPCPPSGVHRYFFTLYALDIPPTLPVGLTKQGLDTAIQDHVIASTQLMGRYGR